MSMIAVKPTRLAHEAHVGFRTSLQRYFEIATRWLGSLAISDRKSLLSKQLDEAERVRFERLIDGLNRAQQTKRKAERSMP